MGLYISLPILENHRLNLSIDFVLGLLCTKTGRDLIFVVLIGFKDRSLHQESGDSHFLA